ncbi:leucyl/phenylalanyl-tRNA--protein transferase [Sansalvadorimonas verongulae]|uniref:leucyl/phenylalanyl-tRNA--protein transferase n=1 Tax=Sansalvadorimonas verongulae TaxID=2172824 RepID=UPI0012BC5A0A|nr:leucyl/phenylalanyl-tRNA--protein transferase [Sansalvadorimonas verongulae]MTI14404.1 leucyl/phenylalanyl-tRNA--protein transferase [Sansalvadorimonas verongulae]
MIPWIDEDNPVFPPVEQALKDPDGLLCAGGNLRPTTLLQAYSHGIFPWYSDGQPLLWWSPDPRMVLTPQTLHVSRSMKRFLRKMQWTVTADKAFPQVIEACSAIPRDDQDGTWITEEMMQAYINLYYLGFTHSIEVWDEKGKLIGGLYGVAMGRVFFGESMFSFETNASKTALVSLMNSGCYDLVDCQMHTAHLETMGGQIQPRSVFLIAMQTLIKRPTSSLVTGVESFYEK